MRCNIGRSLAIPLIATAAIVPITLSASASPAGGVELRFDGTVTSFVAVPARSSGSPQHPGDQVFFDVQLSENRSPVGHSPHHCTAITAEDSLCESVIVLADGQITLQTALGTTNAPPVVHVAVTGGTGIYRNAQGELTLTANPDGSQTWDLELS
jgi:hypothetical protein